MDNHYDVVIAGAGPAGSACAMVLNQAGLKVCLVDAVADEIFKVGESLPGAAVRLLNRLGFRGLDDLLPRQDYQPCVANVSSWGSAHWVYQDAMQNPEGGGWHLNRSSFDRALRDRVLSSGVQYHQGKIAQFQIDPFAQLSGRIHHIQALNASTRFPAGLSAKWIVDATGRRAAISKKLGVKRTRFDIQMAALCWLQPNRIDKDHTTRIKSVEYGWWYSARLPMGSRVVAFFGLPGRIAEMVSHPSAYIDACNGSGLLPYSISTQDLHGKIKATDASVSKLQRAGGDGWVAVGDAALSFDPLSSQGIFFALYSGVRGAEAILTREHYAQNQGLEAATGIDQYQRQIDTIFQANQKSRHSYYLSESRFKGHPYWQQRFDYPAGSG